MPARRFGPDQKDPLQGRRQPGGEPWDAGQHGVQARGRGVVALRHESLRQSKAPLAYARKLEALVCVHGNGGQKRNLGKCATHKHGCLKPHPAFLLEPARRIGRRRRVESSWAAPVLAAPEPNGKEKDDQGGHNGPTREQALLTRHFGLTSGATSTHAAVMAPARPMSTVRPME